MTEKKTPSIPGPLPPARLFDGFCARPPVEEAKPMCDHVPGKFLGPSMIKHYDRYQCAKCGEEFSKKWYDN